ncbi:Cation/H+ exchanger [Arabidopsis thaliana x Arabidopsis arenosa]|uniref:Cation/H+ exchanger n=1 Tax=Arabidopsis thaliana x Arabidopsis arenosa TaxID=1240361 RepID=A0A8T1ZLX5_9BRAS|nr:Cation/H+ exchanger [Arabidopsis thaliana x Arabidopsis arenosa]
MVIIILQTPPKTCISPDAPSKPHTHFPSSNCDSSPRQHLPLPKKNARSWSSKAWKSRLSSFSDFPISDSSKITPNLSVSPPAQVTLRWSFFRSDDVTTVKLAGIILGPQLFDLLEKSSGKLSVDTALDGTAALRCISVFGTLMFTFLMTVRTSRRVAFHSGKLPVVIGIVTFFAPLFSLGFQNLFSDNIDPHYMPLDKAMGERTAIVVTQSSILLPSTTYILLELKIINSELGRLALSACVINDILGIFSMIVASIQATYIHVSHATAYRDIVAVIIFFLVVFLIFKPMVQWVIDRTPEDKPVEDIYIHAIILTALASAVYFVSFNMKYILGPLMIGIIIPEGPPLGSALEAKFERLTMNVFLPISVTFSAMRCDGVRILNQFTDIFFNIFLTFLILVIKLVACLAPCLYYKLPLSESMAVSLILSYKSFADFVLYEAVLDDTYISQATYAFLILYSLLNAGIVPTVLRSMYDPKRKYLNYQKRDILHLEPNSDLRILTCLHKSENVSETIAFLQLLSSPNLHFPIAVTVLHLVKLVGQINPIIVSNNKMLKRLNKNSYIHTANLAFRQFMLESLDSVTVTMFTAFSHENLMHEDICTLALDGMTSMIVVSSGRKWTTNGMFESDDIAIRHLNQSLLDRAPCSIGILVDRGQFSQKCNVTSKRRYNIDVGVLFIGGKDDREALSLVKRMKHNPRVRITVIRLVFDHVIESDWDYILDNEGLKDLKSTKDNKDIVYIERIVTSGVEVVTAVRLLAEEYDLMVVGRDHDMTSQNLTGLMEWVELPELGVIGDLLAARDLNSKAGLILGPQLFNLREVSSRKLSWDPALDGNGPLRGLSVCGNIMLAFLMTVKISRRLAFNNGWLPIVIGVLSFIVPFLGGFCVRNLHTDNIDPQYLSPSKVLAERTVVISSQSSILLPTVVHFLSELKILNSELGRLVLSASLINDIFASIVSIVAYLAGTYKNISPMTAYRDLIAVIILILVVVFVLRPVVEWIVERTPEGKPVADVYVHAAVLSVIASAAYTSFFNMKYLLGPFLLGLIIPEGPPIGSALEAKYEALTMNVLIPISITFSTMRCDVMKIVYQYDDIGYNIFLMLFTGVLKMLTGLVPCLYCKIPLKEAIAASLLLCSKSFSEIFLYESTFDDSYISLATYTFLITCALINSGIIPTALAGLYDPKRKYVGYQKKNIMNLKPNSDLRILTCVHKPENISAAISFLQLLPSTIVVTVLHLVKLVGKIVPVVISHQSKSKRVVTNSYIHTAHLAFSQLESVTMTMFTALTHENLMHDEICKLALEQVTSIIIVPSGRKWTIDGTFESEDEAIRRLNESLLQSASCSIGILVDRGQFSLRGTRRYEINVGVIFIGGKDDREALSLVKKMKHNPRVNITVIRLKSSRETESTNWDYILDHEVLEDLKDTEATNCIAYTERIVTGGPEVATTVRSLSEDYDLMVVGRDHGMASPDFDGLKEWIELPELGVIGDLLAARDLDSRVNVLVVQQQQQT